MSFALTIKRKENELENSIEIQFTFCGDKEVSTIALYQVLSSEYRAAHNTPCLTFLNEVLGVFCLKEYQFSTSAVVIEKTILATLVEGIRVAIVFNVLGHTRICSGRFCSLSHLN